MVKTHEQVTDDSGIFGQCDVGGNTASAVTLKLVAFVPPTSVSGSRVLTPIAEMIEKKSQGDLKIKIY